MKTHEQQCEAVAETLKTALRLVIGVQFRDLAAARELADMCRTVPYEGLVLTVRVDSIVAAILEPEEDEGTEPTNR